MNSDRSISEVPSSDARTPDVGQDAAAHVEPTPATTRPWLFNDECGRIEGHEGSIIFYVAGSSLNPRVEQDVYHTLHAVHSYPRLVAALKDARLQFEYLQSEHKPTGTTEQTLAQIAALLKELGE
jgi:hypothetical protein